MLIKKELEAVPAARPGSFPSNRNYSYAASARIEKLPRSGRILVADFWDIKKEKLAMRFFSDGKSFQTYEAGDLEPWCQKNPQHALDACFSSEAEDRIARDFLLSKKGGYYPRSVLDSVGKFIQDIGYEKRLRQYTNEEALRESHFAMYPAYPSDLQEYCENHLFPETYIFITKLDQKKHRRGTCGHCRKTFAVPRDARSGQEAVCPRCGRKAVYRGSWIQGYLENEEKICIAAKVEGQLLLRWTIVQRRFHYPKFKAEYSFEDYAYNLYLQTSQGPKIYFYKWITPPYGYGPEWYRGKNGDTCWASTYIYPGNLREVFGKSYYNVDLQKGLEGKNTRVSFVKLLNSLKKSEAAEYLFKMGMPTLAEEGESLERSMEPGAKPGFQSVLGISKQLQPMYSELDPSLSEHRVIRKYGAWVSREDLLAYRALQIKNWSSGDVSKLLESMSFRKFVNYFQKQKQRNPKLSMDKILIDYRDYIDMSIGLEVDLRHKSVRFPENCVDAHDQILARYNLKKNEADDRIFMDAVSRIYPRLCCREYEKDGLCIVLPETRSDLITEGQSLNHCVGGEGYYKRHIAGDRMIFFVRQISKRWKPYFTLEIDMSNFRVCQLYGFGDCTAPPAVRKFAEAFARKLSLAGNRKLA